MKDAIEIKRDAVSGVLDNVFSNGKIASVVFVKKDGSDREMVCRQRVTKYLKGGKSNIAHKPNLVSVYDLQSEGYRCINIDTVKQIKGSGKLYRVVG